MRKIILLLSLLISLNSFSQLDTSYHARQIVLDVPDLVKGETVIKRDASLLSMIYNTHDSTLTLVWNIRHYADTSDGYGLYLGTIIPDKIKQTVADNNVMVNTHTGQFVYPDSSGQYPQNIPYIGQYNFFQRLAQYQPILVNALIIQYGKANNWNE